jgi:hypothetical protein
MQTLTPVQRIPLDTHQDAAAALQRLSALRTRLDAELTTLPAPAPALLAPSSSAERDTEIANLLVRLDDYWNATRHESFRSAMEQALADEVTLKIHERDLEPVYATCLPGSDDLNTSISAVHVQLDNEEPVELAGVLVLVNEQGQALLLLPGVGVTGFANLDELRQSFAQGLNDLLIRSALFNTLDLHHQQRLQQIENDPDLYLEPFSPEDLVLPSVPGDAFAHALDSLLRKQRADICHASALQTGASQKREQLIREALEMRGLWGPGALLDLREQVFALRRERQSLPDWIKFASTEDIHRYTEQLQHYDQLRTIVLSALGAAASPKHFAEATLRRRLADDLGLDLDPQAIVVSTQRTLPVTGEVYTTSRSLAELALYGLHPDDLIPGSEFLTQTTLNFADAAPDSADSSMNVGYIAQLIDELDLRVKFGDFQRAAYQKAPNLQLMAVLAGEQITSLAYSAKMQGHISPRDFDLIEATTNPVRSGSAAETRIQQIKLDSRHVLGKLLVFRSENEQGVLDRLIVAAIDAPVPQRFKAFDNETQLLLEVVGWLASDPMRDYLLAQVDDSSQPALARQFAALRLKPYPQADFVQLIDLPDYNAGLHAFAEEQVRAALAEQARHTPPWYLGANREQRQELLALEEAAAGALRNYGKKSHTRIKPFEQYVHERASQQIARLLNVPVGSVDPDQIIIYSERETLSYTEMLRDGYDDSLGLSRTTADTHAKFSGPAGVDLSTLTPQRVTGSVRGNWLADDYLALINSTLLNVDSPGYDYRRRTSLLINQLQMQAAALRSLLKGHINAQQYQWLRESIDHAHLNDSTTRERYPLYPLQIHVDKPFIGSELSGIDKVVIPDTRLIHIETVQGCVAVLPTRIRQAPLLYTPQAPDGFEFRLFGSFIDSLHAPGMLEYYTGRCRIKSRKSMALFLADMRQGNASKAPFLPREAFTDYADICFNRPILRRMRDVEETTTSRHEMLTRLVWTGIELIAGVVTLPFPPASFVIGALMSMHDSLRAVQALRDGDSDAAAGYVLTSLLNSLGAAGDIHSGLKGFGGPLRKIVQRQTDLPLRPVQPSSSLPRYEDLFPVNLRDEPFLLTKPDRHGYAQVFRADSRQVVDATREFVIFRPRTAWQPLGDTTTSAPRVKPATPGELAVSLSLRDVSPVADGHAKGVCLVNGKPYIELSGNTYSVQYDARLRCWQIVDPANPFAFFGKQPVFLDEQGRWQLADRARLHGGMEGSGSYRPLSEEQAAAGPSHSVISEYELPPRMQKHMHIVLDTEPYDPTGYGLESYFETYFGEMRIAFTKLREKLYQDANAFFIDPPLPPKPRLPILTAPVTLETWFKNVFTHGNGLVLSETAKSVASKRLLILNMPTLVEQRVEVLYIEHLFTDRHLPKLAQYRAQGAKSRAGSHEIKYHFKELNDGALDNQTTEYDYYHLVKAAHRHGIEVRPFSSSVSYPLNAHPIASGFGDSLAAQKMSKFFGHQLISGDVAAAPSRRWVALLEHRIANTHDQITGIAELQGVLSAHINDIPAGRPTRLTTGAASGAGVQSDYLIAFSNPLILPPPSALPPSTQLDITLFEALADAESIAAAERWAGDYGFRWDDVGGWQRIEPGEWIANNPSTAIQQSLMDTLYDTPLADRPMTHTLANFQSKGLDQEYYLLDPEMGRVRSAFFTRRRILQTDSAAILVAKRPPRPPLPAVAPNTSPPDFLKLLYEQIDGVVIAESHSSIASKKLIIDNLPLLTRHNVKTLYMEHLLTDLHQADLDRFFETGQMSKTLLHDLKKLDRGHHTDPEQVYTFEKVVMQAQRHGMEIRAIDCTATYHLKGMPNRVDTSRQQMMNYFASRTIRKHQEVMGSHKWIALVGNSHSNTYGFLVPGIAELEGVISLRAVDVPPGHSTGVVKDPGEFVRTGMTQETVEVRGDYRVEIEVNKPAPSVRPPQPLPLEERLARPGLFLIEQSEDGGQIVVHRSRDMQIHRTPVMVDDQGKLYVDRPSWAPAHMARFDDMDALIAALRKIYLTRVG